MLMQGATALILRDKVARLGRTGYWRRHTNNKNNSRVWCDFLHAVQCTTSIRTVELYVGFCYPLSPQQMSELLGSTVGHLPDLQQVTLCGKPMLQVETQFLVFAEFALADLAVLVHNAKKLQRLVVEKDVNVSGDRKDLYQLASALSNHPALTDFLWHGHLAITTTTVSHPRDNLEITTTTTVSALPKYDLIAAALATCPHLRTVSLAVALDPFDPVPQGPDLVPATVTQLVALAPSLTTLHLWTNHWDAVADALVQSSVLETLHLTKRHVMVADCTALGTALRCIRTTARLKCVTLGTHHSPWLDDDNSNNLVQPLAEGLQESSSVTLLRLVYLGKQKKTNSNSSSTSRFSNNNNNRGNWVSDDDDGATTNTMTPYRTLCHLLTTNYNLTVELLDQHPHAAAATASWAATADMIQVHSRLNAVGRGRLVSCGRSGNGTKALDTAGAWVHTLSKLNDDDDDNDNDLLSLNCIYALIRMNPSLCQSS
jgi:hypothetical protein